MRRRRTRQLQSRALTASRSASLRAWQGQPPRELLVQGKQREQQPAEREQARGTPEPSALSKVRSSPPAAGNDANAFGPSSPW